MNRLDQEREYWDKASQAKDVRGAYIVDKNFKDSDFIDLLKPLFKGYTLEIGCGIGRLAELYDCGIDISQGMLDKAPKNKEHKLCDGRTIPYPDETFDSVLCVQVFQHIPYIQPYIAEAFRVLKPGGKFVFQYIKGFTKDGPFSFKHEPELNSWSKVENFKGIYKQWSWITATK